MPTPSLTPTDDLDALDSKIVPDQRKCYRLVFDNVASMQLTLPEDVNYAEVLSADACEMSASYYYDDGENEATDTPGDMTAPLDPEADPPTYDNRRLPHFGGDDREPIFQGDQFNRIVVRFGTAKSLTVYIWTGKGKANQLEEEQVTLD